MIIPKQQPYEPLGLARKHADKKTKYSHVLAVSGEDFDLVPKVQLSGKFGFFSGANLASLVLRARASPWLIICLSTRRNTDIHRDP